MQFLRFSLIFSLIVSSSRYGLNKLFHPLCAVSLHLLRDVSVNVQRKRSGSVSEVFLHGLNVIAALDKCYITYKPNYVHRRISPHIGWAAYASEKESVHRINYDFYIPQDTVYVKRQIFKMWCFIRLRRIFIMRIMYIFRADHRFMISIIRIAAV